ncbi:hypoxanthine-guanine phosphoribosyltransferase [Oceanospirillum beijerinckii]|uniref:hypoxanthine-guanine phosphoribosyltransferase n=1 Tax=Oceanospirillum beijerinckii TaxID=64976 RepID=UPI000418E8D0|nr:hypoxanthine-guanine phosphoribosyltransferase [Oceanospirillum beijerinckii]
MPVESNLEQINKVFAEADCLCTKEQLDTALDKMAAEITEELGDKLPVVYCVMNGGLITTGHLLTRLTFPLQVDYIHATRYRGETTGGELYWRVPPEVNMEGRHVIIVDDILDEGHTLAAILEYCKEQGAEAVYSAVLIDKMHDRKAQPDMKASFTGLEVEDRYLFGFGMDYQGFLRNVPGIYAPKGM